MDQIQSCDTCKYERNGTLEPPCNGCWHRESFKLPNWIAKEQEVPDLCEGCEFITTDQKYNAAIVKIRALIKDNNWWAAGHWLCSEDLHLEIGNLRIKAKVETKKSKQ